MSTNRRHSQEFKDEAISKVSKNETRGETKSRLSAKQVFVQSLLLVAVIAMVLCVAGFSVTLVQGPDDFWSVFRFVLSFLFWSGVYGTVVSTTGVRLRRARR